MAYQNWHQKGGGQGRQAHQKDNRNEEPPSQKFSCTQKDESSGEEVEISFDDGWIQNSLDDKAIQFANCLGKYLSEGNAMTTSQIRNFFGEIRRIQMKGYDDNKPSFLLLRPKLAYAKARVIQKNKNSRITTFQEIFDRAHPKVTSKESFQNYVDFLEAVLAYHKFHGGKEN